MNPVAFALPDLPTPALLDAPTFDSAPDWTALGFHLAVDVAGTTLEHQLETFVQSRQNRQRYGAGSSEFSLSKQSRVQWWLHPSGLAVEIIGSRRDEGPWGFMDARLWAQSLELSSPGESKMGRDGLLRTQIGSSPSVNRPSMTWHQVQRLAKAGQLLAFKDWPSDPSVKTRFLNWPLFSWRVPARFAKDLPALPGTWEIPLPVATATQVTSPADMSNALRQARVQHADVFASAVAQAVSRLPPPLRDWGDLLLRKVRIEAMDEMDFSSRQAVLAGEKPARPVHAQVRADLLAQPRSFAAGDFLDFTVPQAMDLARWNKALSACAGKTVYAAQVSPSDRATLTQWVNGVLSLALTNPTVAVDWPALAQTPVHIAGQPVALFDVLLAMGGPWLSPALEIQKAQATAALPAFAQRENAAGEPLSLRWARAWLTVHNERVVEENLYERAQVCREALEDLSRRAPETVVWEGRHTTLWDAAMGWHINGIDEDLIAAQVKQTAGFLDWLPSDRWPPHWRTQKISRIGTLLDVSADMRRPGEFEAAWTELEDKEVPGVPMGTAQSRLGLLAPALASLRRAALSQKLPAASPPHPRPRSYVKN